MVKTEEQLRTEFIEKCNEVTQAQMSRNLQVSRSYISDIAKGNRGISAEIAKFLGYKLKVETTRVYEKIK